MTVEKKMKTEEKYKDILRDARRNLGDWTPFKSPLSSNDNEEAELPPFPYGYPLPGDKNWF